jgi:hypothetical protein
MSFKEGEEMEAEGVCNIFSKVIAENFSNL